MKMERRDMIGRKTREERVLEEGGGKNGKEGGRKEVVKVVKEGLM